MMFLNKNSVVEVGKIFIIFVIRYKFSSIQLQNVTV